MRYFCALLVTLPCLCAGPPIVSKAQSVFDQLTVANFAGKGQDSIQAISTDSAGNIYIAGTTSSPDFPVKNAAQPRIGDRLIRSLDLGATWTALGDPLVGPLMTIAPDPSTPTTLLAGGGGAISKSTDGGQSWRLVYTQPANPAVNPAFEPQPYIVIMPENPSRVLAILNARLIASDDGGETWSSVPGVSGSHLTADPNFSGTVFLLSGPGLLISRDEGKT